MAKNKIREGDIFCSKYTYNIYQVVAIGSKYVTMQSMRKNCEAFRTITREDLLEHWEESDGYKGARK